jgi:hypothetical protein
MSCRQPAAAVKVDSDGEIEGDGSKKAPVAKSTMKNAKKKEKKKVAKSKGKADDFFKDM